MAVLGHGRDTMRALASAHEPTTRDHRWRAGWQHRGDRRGDARCRGHARRARRDRRRRAPVGLHPVEGDDRHRRRARRTRPRRHHGPRGERRARRRRAARTACTRSRSSCGRRCAACWSPRVCGWCAGPRTSPTRTRSRWRATPGPPRCPATCSWSRPAPGHASPTGPRSTANACSPPGRRIRRPRSPTHLCVIGSGVTGVEFTHMFSALGSEVTLVVSRQQVLPLKDAEVAAVLEDEFLGARRPPAQGRACHRRDPHRRRRARRL